MWSIHPSHAAICHQPDLTRLESQPVDGVLLGGLSLCFWWFLLHESLVIPISFGHISARDVPETNGDDHRLMQENLPQSMEETLRRTPHKLPLRRWLPSCNNCAHKLCTNYSFSSLIIPECPL